jgi:hypothetical protein
VTRIQAGYTLQPNNIVKPKILKTMEYGLMETLILEKIWGRA